MNNILNHSEQLKKLVDTIRETQSFVNNSITHGLIPEKEVALNPESLEDEKVNNENSEFV